jgi:hypothetical protein
LTSGNLYNLVDTAPRLFLFFSHQHFSLNIIFALQLQGEKLNNISHVNWERTQTNQLDVSSMLKKKVKKEKSYNKMRNKQKQKCYVSKTLEAICN